MMAIAQRFFFIDIPVTEWLNILEYYLKLTYRLEEGKEIEKLTDRAGGEQSYRRSSL